MTDKKKYTGKIEEDPDNPGELLLVIDPEAIEELEWKEGDTLTWTDNKDGSWTLSRNKND